MAVSQALTESAYVTLTRAESSFIFLRMWSSHAVDSSAAFELALIGVTALCVADIHCR